MRDLPISLFTSAADAAPRPATVPWELLKAELLTHERRESKGGHAWNACKFDGAGRSASNVELLSCAIFDLEGPGHRPLTGPEITAFAKHLEGLEYVAHSTFSGPTCLRLVLPLARDITPSEWGRLRGKLVTAWGLPADPSTADAGRLYFLPEAKPGAEVVAEGNVGAWLNPDEWLTPVATPAPTPVPVSTPAPTTVDLGPIRAALGAVRGKSKALADTILSGRALAQPGARDNTVNQAASLIATLCPENAALGVLEASLLAMECAPEGVDYWAQPVSYTHLTLPTICSV